MEQQLFEKVHEEKKDNLIYDYLRLIDSRAVTLTLTGDTAGTVRRGQVIDFDAGRYSLHATGGTANCIVAESTEYAKGDTEVVVPVYISGDFRTSAVLSDVELTDTDTESLRGFGVVLK